MQQSKIRDPETVAWIFNPYCTPRFELDKCGFDFACDLVCKNWQVCPEIAPPLLEQSKYNFESEARTKLTRRITSATVFGRILNMYCKQICSTLNNAGIPYVLLKGSACRVMAYSPPEQRSGLDIDLAVPIEAIYDAEELVKGLGFWAAEYNKDTNRFYHAGATNRRIVESKHFELGFLAKRHIVGGLDSSTQSSIVQDTLCPPWHTSNDEELECFVSVDIHHGLGLDLSAKPMIQTADVREFEGVSVRIPNHEWLAFHLIYKIYWEGVHFYNKGAYQLTDLTKLMSSAEIRKFVNVLDILHEYNLEVGAYYVLKALNKYLHVELSDAQKEFMSKMRYADPSSSAFSLNDLGDMWPKLWGIR